MTHKPSAWEVLKVSLKLGLTSFGGPVAHLGYFHNEYVEKKKWIDAHAFADLVALCQFLPGPASSQVSIGIGVTRAGFWGGIAAWIGFTLPSAILMVLFATLLKSFELSTAGFVHGLKIVAVVIVAHSLLSMAKKLANEKLTATIAVLSAVTLLLFQSAITQILVILVSGFIGMFLFGKRHSDSGSDAHQNKTHISAENSKSSKAFILVIGFFALLVALPIVREFNDNRLLEVFDGFYRSGALVFGGGHVILPLLELEVIPPGWVSKADFIAGYGAAQAVPGPLLSFASYLGFLIDGFKGAFIALIAIFAPAFLLIVGVMPYWNKLRQNKQVKTALIGVNASVVGILLAALYNPLWTNAIVDAKAFALAIILYVLMAFWRFPALAIVFLGALGGFLL